MLSSSSMSETWTKPFHIDSFHQFPWSWLSDSEQERIMSEEFRAIVKSAEDNDMSAVNVEILAEFGWALQRVHNNFLCSYIIVGSCLVLLV